jgi:hypothetical protein
MRTLMFQAHVPEKFWAESLATATATVVGYCGRTLCHDSTTTTCSPWCFLRAVLRAGCCSYYDNPLWPPSSSYQTDESLGCRLFSCSCPFYVRTGYARSSLACCYGG